MFTLRFDIKYKVTYFCNLFYVTAPRRFLGLVSHFKQHVENNTLVHDIFFIGVS